MKSMRLNVLGSSSKGNGYVLYNDSEALLIECGVRIIEVKKMLGFNLSIVSGAVLSHEHLDHAGFVDQYINAGIDVYSSRGTFEALGVSGHRVHHLVPEALFKIGPFKVIPFPVEHDCSEPFGFLIYHPECGNILFATDTCFLQYTFPGLNNIMIEANYDQEILEEGIRAGRTPELIRKRVMNNHMELGVLVDTLKANDLSQVNKIVLIHLSEKSGDPDLFQKIIEEATGKNVFVAAPGLDIHFDKTPF